MINNLHFVQPPIDPIDTMYTVNGTRYVTINGETHKLREWLAEYGVTHKAFRNRMLSGWELREAITVPMQSHHKLTDPERKCTSDDKLYHVWRQMKQRCGNDNNKDAKNYRKRGIRVCNIWNESYRAFEEWARFNGYRDGLTIDRIDVDRGYNPDNCRWVTAKEQNKNKQADKHKPEQLRMETNNG